MAGSVHIPWYATVFRGDELQAELERVSPLALRYGATGYSVYRSNDDTYRLLQILDWEEHVDWERWWSGPEMIDFRAYCQGWYQIPVQYAWHELVTKAYVPRRSRAGANGH